MSVLGIDFGNDNCVIAIARRRGIDVVTNDMSNRSTPSVVSFTPKQRLIGETGANQAVMNWQNTIFGVKNLLGLKFSSPEAQKEMSKLPLSFHEGPDSSILIEVTYRNQKRRFTAYRVVAMILQQLRQYAEKEVEGHVRDCVISVPAYFTDLQRREMMAASKIAGLNCLKLINDTTAAALYYGLFHPDLPDQPENIVFADMGHSNFSVAVVEVGKHKLKVLSTAFERTVGARDFDDVLVNYFVDAIKEKYGMDVSTNAKAKLRLEQGVKRLKKVLSANSVGNLNIECLMNDKDVSFSMERSQFEALCQPLLDQLNRALTNALAESGIPRENIVHMEIFGGGSYIPSVKHTLAQAFGVELRTSLNATEAVGRGCAIQGAMLSPSFRVREFLVTDATAFGMSLHWQAGAENKSSQVFKKHDAFPSTKMISFKRAGELTLVASYDDLHLLPEGTDPFIGRFVVKNTSAEEIKIKARVKLNAHGLLSVSAQSVEEIEVPAEETPKPAEGAGQDTEMPAATTTKSVKKDLEVVSFFPGVTHHEVEVASNEETSMQIDDREVMQTAEKKNEVESYIYDMRSRMAEYGDLHDFITPDVVSKFSSLCDSTEDWLYSEEGEDASLSAYAEKLAEMHKFGEPAKMRFDESMRRDEFVASLLQTVETYRSEALSNAEKYSHIEQKDKDSVVERCNLAEAWVQEKMAKQATQAKHINPVVKCSEIEAKKKELDIYCPGVLNRPKPAPKKEAPKKEEAKPEGPKEGGATPSPMEEDHPEGAGAQPTDMDLD